MKDVIVSWSGGKDSAYALYLLQKSEQYNVKGLLSTTSSESGRLPMHEVKRELIHTQSESIGLPLYEVLLPSKVDNDTYNQLISKELNQFKKENIDMIVHADIFLEDIKAYRDRLLARIGMKGHYPLWKKDTREVAQQFINTGFRAIVTTIDTEKISEESVGKLFDQTFIDQLPIGVDPCGEYGEFHTFVYDGPLFNQPVHVNRGKWFDTMDGRFIHVELK